MQDCNNILLLTYEQAYAFRNTILSAGLPEPWTITIEEGDKKQHELSNNDATAICKFLKDY